MQLLTIEQLPPNLRATAIASVYACSVAIIRMNIAKYRLQRVQIPLDKRINTQRIGRFNNDLRRAAALLENPPRSIKIIEENLMHFNEKGECYSYTLKKFFPVGR